MNRALYCSAVASRQAAVAMTRPNQRRPVASSSSDASTRVTNWRARGILVATRRIARRGRGAASETSAAAPATPTSAVAATSAGNSRPNVKSAARTATKHRLTTSRILAMTATPEAWATLTPRRCRASPTNAISAEGPGSNRPAAHDAAVTPTSSTGLPSWRGRKSQNRQARLARNPSAPATANSTGNGVSWMPSHSTERPSARQASTSTPTETTLAMAALSSARLRRRAGELMARDCPQTAFPACCEAPLVVRRVSAWG